MLRKAFLIYVDGDGVNSNKYYNMFELDNGTFEVKYGRVGGHETKGTKPVGKWDSTLKSKVRKGYTDISHLKENTSVIQTLSNNDDFNSFYNLFSKYAKNSVSRSYLVDSTTPQQLQEAQNILNNIIKIKDKVKINAYLTELYKVIPRRMAHVSDYLITNVKKQKKELITREQDALDGMDSNNITRTVNPFDNLNIDFKEVKTPKWLRTKIESTINKRYNNKSIYKCFKVSSARQTRFNDWMKNQKNQQTEHLFHGTRNANIFSILKSGLLIRPSNAAYISGAAYGNGIYTSKDTAKSLGYTGYDTDSLFLITNTHIGKQYNYQGWYRDGKDLSRKDMTYKGMQDQQCDSLFVHSGDGLLSSELIFYREEQVVIDYIIWFK